MQRRLVIVVEDDPTLRELVEEHLRGVGFEVAAFANGDAALRLLRDRRPDLLCLDLNLPSVSGFDLCEHIRSDPRLKDVAILMTSASVLLEARAYSFEAGADAYLRKPYTLEELTSEIARLLEGPPGSVPRYS
jgi:two-component system phosphate regulon response regulator PhoB